MCFQYDWEITAFAGAPDAIWTLLTCRDRCKLLHNIRPARDFSAGSFQPLSGNSHILQNINANYFLCCYYTRVTLLLARLCPTQYVQLRVLTYILLCYLHLITFMSSS